jgi:transposase
MRSSTSVLCAELCWYRNVIVISVAAGTKVYLACQPVSMRLGFDGLAVRVSQVLHADPFSGHSFLFRSKRADYLKLLHYDGTGLCLFAKRLERGRFIWPPIVDGQMSLTEPRRVCRRLRPLRGCLETASV